MKPSGEDMCRPLRKVLVLKHQSDFEIGVKTTVEQVAVVIGTHIVARGCGKDRTPALKQPGERIGDLTAERCVFRLEVVIVTEREIGVALCVGLVTVVVDITAVVYLVEGAYSDEQRVLFVKDEILASEVPILQFLMSWVLRGK